MSAPSKVYSAYLTEKSPLQEKPVSEVTVKQSGSALGSSVARKHTTRRGYFPTVLDAVRKYEATDLKRSENDVVEGKRIIVAGQKGGNLSFSVPSVQPTTTNPNQVIKSHNLTVQEEQEARDLEYEKQVRNAYVDRAGEVLDQHFLSTSVPLDPSATNIFNFKKTVLYRGLNDSLIAERYINEPEIQSIELKYYNESSGLNAPSFLVDFQLIPVHTPSYPNNPPDVHPGLRRGPILVPNNNYTSLGQLHKTKEGSGKFGYFMFIDALVSATPPGLVNDTEITTAPFMNKF